MKNDTTIPVTHRMQHLLRQPNGHTDLHPIHRRAPPHNPVLLNPKLPQPRVHSLQRVRMGLHKRLDVRLGEVLPVARVGGVAHRIEVRLELGETVLREGNAQVEEGVGGCAGVFGPAAWVGDGLFDEWCGTRSDGEAEACGEETEEERTEAEGEHFLCALGCARGTRRAFEAAFYNKNTKGRAYGSEGDGWSMGKRTT